jgi:hypothetical protein
VNKLLKPLVVIVMLGIILSCGYVLMLRYKKDASQVEAKLPPPEWTRASSLLLDIDYEFKTDTFVILEGDTYDYQLNMIGKDWGIYIHRLKGFAKAFITGKPTTELYQLIGDSDLYKWQQAWNLTPSEPIYSIYKKDDHEHLRQDFSVDVTQSTDIPDYFPPGLTENIKSGEVVKIAGGTFYYISSSDIYMVHYIAPYPLGDKDRIIVETVNRLKFNAGQEAETAKQTDGAQNLNSSSTGAEGDSKTGADNSSSNDTGKPVEPPDNSGGGGNGGGSGGGDIKPLPPIDSSS